MRALILSLFIISNFTLALGLSGCSTPRHKALRGIAVGMDKAEVLDRAGNPTRIARVHSQDRWTYEVESSARSVDVTYVFFAEGRVTYIGSSAEPEARPAVNSPATSRSHPKTQKLPSDTFKAVGE